MSHYLTLMDRFGISLLQVIMGFFVCSIIAVVSRYKNGTSRTTPITVRIAVAPYLNCEAEILTNDSITLTTQDLSKEKLWLKISTPPQGGNLTSLRSEDATPVKYDQVFKKILFVMWRHTLLPIGLGCPRIR